MTPVVNRLWWQLVTAFDHARMFAQDVALGRNDQPVGMPELELVTKILGLLYRQAQIYSRQGVALTVRTSPIGSVGPPSNSAPFIPR